MACAQCLAHRERIKKAIQKGSITGTAVESASALRTLNEKMVASLLRRQRGVASRPKS